MEKMKVGIIAIVLSELIGAESYLYYVYRKKETANPEFNIQKNHLPKGRKINLGRQTKLNIHPHRIYFLKNIEGKQDYDTRKKPGSTVCNKNIEAQIN